jgi:hypothetical protein
MLGKKTTKGSMLGPRWKPEAGVSALQVLLNPMITYGKERTK